LALKDGSIEKVIKLLTDAIGEGVRHRFHASTIARDIHPMKSRPGASSSRLMSPTCITWSGFGGMRQAPLKATIRNMQKMIMRAECNASVAT
jgi:hypothetical protein